MNFYKIAILWRKIDALLYKSQKILRKGDLVEVFLKKEKLKGIVVDVSTFENKKEEEIKNVEAVLQEQFLKENYIDSLWEIKHYYFKKWGTVVGTAVPKQILKREVDEYLPPQILSFPSLSSNSFLEKILKSKKKEIMVEMEGDIFPLLVHLISFFVSKRNIVVLFPEKILLEIYLHRIKNFIKSVYAYHSFLRPKEKRKIWWGIKEGKIKIVFGLRGEVFLPVVNPAVFIIVDLGDSSFREKMREFSYDILKILELRCKHEDLKIIGISPYIMSEIRYESESGKIALFVKKRKKNVLISVEDLRKRKEILLPQVEKEISARLERKEKIFVYINRKGYSLYLQCFDCGYVRLCKNCGIAMRYSKDKHLLYCTSCGAKEKAPEKCPECGGVSFLYKGIGIENVRDYFIQKFSNKKILVIEGDSYLKFKKALEQGFDIMIGTRGAVKHIRIKGLSVGVIVRADYDIFLPNFRAQEESFAIYTTIIDSLDEKKSPVLFIQTYKPYYRMFSYLENKSYRFYINQITARKKLSYPPFKNMVLFKANKSEVLLDFREKLLKNPKINVTLPYKRDKQYCILAKITKDISISELISDFEKKIDVEIDPVEVL